MKKNTPELIESLIKGPANDFKEHLALEDNHRLIFSAPFGFGKTTFLQQFFTEEQQIVNLGEKKYEVIHLYPVNYSIASNEDIFKYIKYDIISELLMNFEVVLDDTQFSVREDLPDFIAENFTSFLSRLLLLIPKVGKSLFEVYEKTDKLREKYLEYHKQLNEDDFALVSKLHEEMTKNEGSLYEDNIYTDLITDILFQLKGESNKETILILDDLDRIDPHHIFRLFNVFAAHFDTKDDQANKYGFEKVMFVCDINNIRNIFKAKYGLDVDFNGYIDKFFSKHVYAFNYTQHIQNILKEFVPSIKVNLSKKSNSIIDFSLATELTRDYAFLISTFIQSQAINLRAFLKLYKKTIDIQYKELPNLISLFPYVESYTNNYNLNILLLFDLLVIQIGDVEGVVKILERCYQYTRNGRQYTRVNSFKTNYQSMLERTLLILGNIDHSMTNAGNYKYTIEYEKGNCVISYTFKNQQILGVCELNEIRYFSINGEELDISVEVEPNIFLVYKECLKVLQELKYFS